MLRLRCRVVAKTQGFHFFVLSRAPESVTLTKIKVTGEDFKTMMSVPDITLPPALVDSR